MQCCRKVKNFGVPVVIGGDNLPSPVQIGLTDLQDIGGASGPPGPPVPAPLTFTTRGADYAHHIYASPPGFENQAASLYSTLDVYLWGFYV